MSALDVAVAFLKAHEGCRLAAYPDPISKGDPWTIGWGHTGKEVRAGLTWTQGQADSQLVIDASRVQHIVEAMIDQPMNDNQKAAFVCLAYNIGLGGGGMAHPGFEESAVRRCFNAGDLQGAAEGFMHWCRAGADPEALRGRRLDEQALFLRPMPDPI